MKFFKIVLFVYFSDGTEWSSLLWIVWVYASLCKNMITGVENSMSHRLQLQWRCFVDEVPSVNRELKS